MAVTSNTTTRRALLGALAAAPMLVAVPALGIPTGSASFAAAHARYIATRDALNRLPDDFELTHPAAFKAMEDGYSDAASDLDDATPTNWREFVQKLEHTIGDGVCGGADLCNQLIGEAKRLAGH